MKILKVKNIKIILDDDDFEWVKAKKWHVTETGYIRHFEGYLHRLIMKVDKNMQVDHVNGNRLDNRKNNLRICTKSENLKNKLKYKNNSTGYKGVNIHEGLIRAQISLDGRSKHLGIFKTLEQAAEAYNDAALKYYGNYANLN